MKNFIKPLVLLFVLGFLTGVIFTGIKFSINVEAGSAIENGVPVCLSPYSESCGDGCNRQVNCGSNKEFRPGPCECSNPTQPQCPVATIWDGSTCKGTAQGTKDETKDQDPVKDGGEKVAPKAAKPADPKTRDEANKVVAGGGSSATGSQGQGVPATPVTNPGASCPNGTSRFTTDNICLTECPQTNCLADSAGETRCCQHSSEPGGDAEISTNELTVCPLTFHCDGTIFANSGNSSTGGAINICSYILPTDSSRSFGVTPQVINSVQTCDVLIDQVSASSGGEASLGSQEVPVEIAQSILEQNCASKGYNMRTDIPNYCEYDCPVDPYRNPAFATILGAVPCIPNDAQGQNTKLPRLTNLIPKVSAQAAPPLPQTINPEDLEKGVYVITIPGYKNVEISILYGNLKLKYFVDSNGDGVKQTEEEYLDLSDYEVSVAKTSSINTYQLDKGWNLVGLNFVSEDLSTASKLLRELIRQNVESVQLTKYDSGNWIHFVMRISDKGEIITYGNDFTLVPGEGYFLRTLNEGAVSLAGNSFTSNVPVSFVPGWNLISIQTIQQYTAQSFLEFCNTQSLNCESISRFVDGLYDTVVKKESKYFGNIFNIEDTKGYFVLNNEGQKVITP